jgi:hypothetical protein
VGATVLMCLALGGVSAVAEEATASQDEPVAVTGLILGMCEVETGTETAADGLRRWRGWTVTCPESMSDPRVSGLSEHDYSRDCRYSSAGGDADDASPIGCVIWSEFVLTGPDGTWDGADRGFITADGERDTYRVATGTGAYAGWTYVSHTDDSNVSGLIYEGPPPPWAPLPSTPSASPPPPSE